MFLQEAFLLLEIFAVHYNYNNNKNNNNSLLIVDNNVQLESTQK